MTVSVISVADHRIQRIRCTVQHRQRRTADERIEQGRDDRVHDVLRDRLHDGSRELLFVERICIPAYNVASVLASIREIALAQRIVD
ncbi:hypothetical protein D3C86_1992170 [compost metagenome]